MSNLIKISVYQAEGVVADTSVIRWGPGNMGDAGTSVAGRRASVADAGPASSHTWAQQKVPHGDLSGRNRCHDNRLLGVHTVASWMPLPW